MLVEAVLQQSKVHLHPLLRLVDGPVDARAGDLEPCQTAFLGILNDVRLLKQARRYRLVVDTVLNLGGELVQSQHFVVVGRVLSGSAEEAEESFLCACLGKAHKVEWLGLLCVYSAEMGCAFGHDVHWRRND